VNSADASLAPSGIDRLRRRYLGFIARHEAAWELVFAGLAIVFVLVGFAENSPILEAVDLGLTAIFVAEFTSRLAASFNRRAYLKAHWIDAAALVPTVRGVRVLRLLRLLRLVRAFAGMARALGTLERLSRHRGLLWVFAAWSAVMVLCSLALFAAENGINDTVSSPLDALWWGVVTMTTVGYGDVIPKTPEGRIAATVLMVLGIALFSAVTATITSFLVAGDSDPLDDLGRLGDLRDRGILTEEQFNRSRDIAVAQLERSTTRLE
jgi:voltage-gated potassium channel